MRQIGSQNRETLEESGHAVFSRHYNGREVVLVGDDGKRELWYRNDHAAGYVIEINGRGYEFARNL